MRALKGERGRNESEAGASAVEFALIVPILVLFVFGIIEFGIAYNRVQSFQAAAREAGRLASVGVDVESGAAHDRVRDVAGSTVDASQVVVSVTTDCPETPSTDPDVADFLVVEVGLSDPGAYPIRVPFLNLPNPDYRAEAVFRCEVRP